MCFNGECFLYNSDNNLSDFTAVFNFLEWKLNASDLNLIHKKFSEITEQEFFVPKIPAESLIH